MARNAQNPEETNEETEVTETSTIGKRVDFDRDTYESLNNISNVTGLTLGEIIGVFVTVSDHVTDDIVEGAFEAAMRDSFQKKLTLVSTLRRKSE